MDSATRNTKQKALILSCLRQHGDSHFTVDEITERLRESRVSKATVYRFLKQLENEGAVKRYVLNEKVGACYQYVGDRRECNEHFHLVCCVCGKVFHVDDCRVEQFVQSTFESLGFKIDSRKTVFYGVCKSCSAE